MEGEILENNFRRSRNGKNGKCRARPEKLFESGEAFRVRRSPPNPARADAFFPAIHRLRRYQGFYCLYDRHNSEMVLPSLRRLRRLALSSYRGPCGAGSDDLRRRSEAGMCHSRRRAWPAGSYAAALSD